ncbi:MAG: hypothetical protein CL778_03530 [Chloroflexi bacterium]|nr:hypothetical protein [Chloroflexota bacterium]
MDEIASALISLQELDQILSKQKIRFVKISRVIEQDGGLVKLQSDYDKIKRDNLQFQLNVSKIDSEILEIQTKSSELQEKLYGGSITNMRELTAIEAEYNSLSNIITEKNQERTNALSQVSDTKESMEKMNIDLDQIKNLWREKKKSLLKEKSEIGKRFNSKLKDRNQFIEKIPEDIFKDYNRLFKANNGIAIVTVKRDICQGCLVKLPVGDIDKMKNSSLPVLCNSGKHFLTE